MICPKCGNQNIDGARFCIKCGNDLSGYAPAANAPVANASNTTAKPGNGFAIASMVLGIVSFFCFGFITSLLAIIFGGVAKSKGSTSPMATAGIVCGVIALALTIIAYIACSCMGSATSYYEIMRIVDIMDF